MVQSDNAADVVDSGEDEAGDFVDVDTMCYVHNQSAGVAAGK
jgi:hypothetical protein